MPHLAHAGLSFHYLDDGSGTPFILQHGLGANVQQPHDLYAPQPGFRFITMDCRGHGLTHPLGDPQHIGFNTFAEDVLALMEALMLPAAVVGGISMGAGVALNLATRFPERVLGLVLSRPAWLAQPMPDNLRCLTTVARFIRQYGAAQGRELFKRSDTYRHIQQQSPDAAASLLGQFDEPRAEESVARLERIPADVPCADPNAWAAIRVPTLVLANRMDPIHPFEYGVTLAHAIPGARQHELTPKSISRARHQQETQQHLSDFLRGHFA